MKEVHYSVFHLKKNYISIVMSTVTYLNHADTYLNQFIDRFMLILNVYFIACEYFPI